MSSSTSAEAMNSSSQAFRSEWNTRETTVLADSTSARFAEGLELSQFDGLLSALFAAGADRRYGLHRWVVTELANGSDNARRVDLLLARMMDASSPHRLDIGIDVLSDRQVPLEQFLGRIAESVFKDAPDDIAYVLVRAAARQSRWLATHVLTGALSSHRQALREAAVEALSDLRSIEGEQELRKLQESDPSPFIRRLAAEALEEF